MKVKLPEIKIETRTEGGGRVTKVLDENGNEIRGIQAISYSESVNEGPITVLHLISLPIVDICTEAGAEIAPETVDKLQKWINSNLLHKIAFNDMLKKLKV